jgi:undecaprenyl-diphosphatase
VDHGLLHALNGFLAHHDYVEDPVLAYSNFAELLFLVLLAGLFVFTRGFTRRAARRGVIAAGLSAAVALAIAQVLAALVDRPRPFVSDPGGVHLFARHVADPGFPSDHATAGFAIAVAILLRSRRWGYVTLALATVLSISRVALGIHFPTDVLAGAALGGATALALWIPPLRGWLHALADRLGGVWDGAVAAIGRFAAARW